MTMEDFFEANFSYESEPSENLRTALSLLYEKYKLAEIFASEVCAGVCMDEIEAEVVLRGVVYAYKFVCDFLAESGLTFKGDIIETLKGSENAEVFTSRIAC